MADKAILYDASKCTACRGCQVGCKQWNENDEDIPTTENGVDSYNWGSYENPRDLSPSTWLKMRFTEYDGAGKMEWLFTRQACMHCPRPQPAGRIGERLTIARLSNWNSRVSGRS